MTTSLLVLLAIATVSLIVVRVGATALMMTGVSWDTSKFQAYSAFFGVGFTTSEAEMVVNHPIRRRIIRNLILIGNIGLTSALASLVVTFVQPQDSSDKLASLGFIIIGAIVFAAACRSGVLQRGLDWAIRLSLTRAGVVNAMDYELLLHVRAGYSVSEIEILPKSRLAGKTLKESRPADVGIVLFGIQRDGGDFVGAPSASDKVEAGDVVMVYGKDEDIKEIALSGS